VTKPLGQDGILPVTIEQEMQRSYLDYAMSVIVSRALPDARDGLKPVHRRILYAMHEIGMDYNKAHRKSANVTGQVMGKYHPHGNTAIYDAMVRMAQNWSMRLPLIDGHGNFGSMDGDPPAAERYTEARLAHPAHFLLEDIDKETVDFQPNYDNTTKEPVVLPARFPNTLVNGGGGIAVGMATNIPPHNLGEVIDGCCALVDNPDMSLEEIMAYIPGPDFPTGGFILGRGGIHSAYKTGRGSIVMRARSNIESFGKDREAIIVTEVPFQVNKAKMIERIAELVNSKVIEGISDLRDESSREGVRVVIELKRDAVSDVVLNQLYKHSALQTSFGANVLALHGGQPKVFALKELLQAFIEFREEVITRRVRYELRKAREKSHVLIGLVISVANIDEMIVLIRKAPDPSSAKESLIQKSWPLHDLAPLIERAGEPLENLKNGYYTLSETQAKAILDLRLHKLTGLERDKISGDLEILAEKIQDYIDILGSRARLIEILKSELLDVKERFQTPRRSEIIESEYIENIEELIQREEMVVTLSHRGYIKRVPLDSYRAQRRGGKGRTGMATRDEDFVRELFVANTHTVMLFFSNFGKVYKKKVYSLPIGSPQSLGKALINILPLEKGEAITTLMTLPEDKQEWSQSTIAFATSMGTVRRNALDDFTNIKSNGKIAMKLGDNEFLIGVKVCNEDQDILLTTRKGKCIRFNADQVRVFSSRNSTGVRGIKLAEDDAIISMAIIDQGDFTTEEREAYLKISSALRDKSITVEEAAKTSGLTVDRVNQLFDKEQVLLSVTTLGFGKRTSSYAYRAMGRGGQGYANMELTPRNGEVIDVFSVEDTDQVMLVTNTGQLIRCPVHGIRIAGRRTQGVTLFRVGKDEKVVSVARINEEAEGDDSIDAENPEPTDS